MEHLQVLILVSFSQSSTLVRDCCCVVAMAGGGIGSAMVYSVDAASKLRVLEVDVWVKKQVVRWRWR